MNPDRIPNNHEWISKKQGFDSAVRRVLLDLQWFDTSFRADDVKDHGPWMSSFLGEVFLKRTISSGEDITILVGVFVAIKFEKQLLIKLDHCCDRGTQVHFPPRKTRGKNPNNLVKNIISYHIISYQIISYHIYLYNYISFNLPWILNLNVSAPNPVGFPISYRLRGSPRQFGRDLKLSSS